MQRVRSRCQHGPVRRIVDIRSSHARARRILVRSQCRAVSDVRRVRPRDRIAPLAHRQLPVAVNNAVVRQSAPQGVRRRDRIHAHRRPVRRSRARQRHVRHHVPVHQPAARKFSTAEGHSRVIHLVRRICRDHQRCRIYCDIHIGARQGVIGRVQRREIHHHIRDPGVRHIGSRSQGEAAQYRRLVVRIRGHAAGQTDIRQRLAVGDGTGDHGQHRCGRVHHIAAGGADIGKAGSANAGHDHDIGGIIVPGGRRRGQPDIHRPARGAARIRQHGGDGVAADVIGRNFKTHCRRVCDV